MNLKETQDAGIAGTIDTFAHFEPSPRDKGIAKLVAVARDAVAKGANPEITLRVTYPDITEGIVFEVMTTIAGDVEDAWLARLGETKAATEAGTSIAAE